MNEHVRPSPTPRSWRPEPGTTRFADGMERRRWTAEEVRRMLDAGILLEDEPFELIGGELVARMQKGNRHELVRTELTLWWADRRPRFVKFAGEAPLRLGPHSEPEPDLVLFPATLGINDVRGDSVLLVVEIADSSLRWDKRQKASIYAGFGVRDYWVIEAESLATLVHREPGPSGYARIETVEASAMLTPLLVPELALRLADLEL